MSRSGASYGQTTTSNTWTASQTFNGNNTFAGLTQNFSNAAGVTFVVNALQAYRFAVAGGITHFVVQDNGLTGSLLLQDVGVGVAVPNGGVSLTVTSGLANADVVIGSKGTGNVIVQANGITSTLIDQFGALTIFGSIVSDGPGGTGPGIFASGVAGGVKLRANPSDDTRTVSFDVTNGWQASGFGFTSKFLDPSGNQVLAANSFVAPASRLDTWAAGALSVGSVTATSVLVGRAGQSLGFYGVAAVARAAAIPQPASTASTNVSPFGYTTAAQADAIRVGVQSLITALQNLGLTS